jgi:hypothetical protein
MKLVCAITLTAYAASLLRAQLPSPAPDAALGAVLATNINQNDGLLKIRQ